jgi:IS30 family transposase
VDATETRQHIEFLRRNGIGLGTIAAKVGYHRSNIQRIARGQQARVARELEEKVLAIPSIAKSDHLYVSTAPLKKLLKKLEKKGITKADVARFMGYKNSYIQLKDFVRIYRFRKIEEACNYLLRSHRD